MKREKGRKESWGELKKGMRVKERNRVEERNES